MASLKKNLRDRLAILRGEGLEVLEVILTGGTHRKVRVRTPAGVEAVVIMSVSDSDGRAHMNLRRDARRIAAEQPTNGRHKPSDSV